MKINIKELKKWIAALDSGKYTQSFGCLESSYGFCCLGVACRILIPENKHDKRFNGTLWGGLPSDQSHAPKWLIKIDDDFCEKTGKSLIQLNDNDGFSFSEIATLLELVYIHKILD